MDYTDNISLLHSMRKTQKSSKPKTKVIKVIKKNNLVSNYLYFSFPRIK